MTTHRCAVIGSPIDHSLSPVIHRRAYELLDLPDWRYDAIEVDQTTLPAFLASCGPQWVGLSVTAPNKQALLAHGVPSARATLLQAANTLIFGRDGQPNQLENTDVTGLISALREHGVSQVRNAILLGAGATARAALAALAELGLQQVTVCARNAQRAHDSLAELSRQLGVGLDIQPWGLMPVIPGAQSDVLVSSAPIELAPEYAAALVHLTPTVFNVIYSSAGSSLNDAAQAADRELLDGLDLLVHQGVDQIRLMTGREVSPTPLLHACRAAAAARQ